MNQCSVCGRSMHTAGCPECEAAYKRDLANNHFPKGFTKENFGYTDWVWAKTEPKFLRGCGYNEERIARIMYEESVQRNALREQQKNGTRTIRELEEKKKYAALYDPKNDPY